VKFFLIVSSNILGSTEPQCFFQRWKNLGFDTPIADLILLVISYCFVKYLFLYFFYITGQKFYSHTLQLLDMSNRTT